MGNIPEKMRITRGPHLECFMMRPRQAQVGHGLDYSLGSYTEAEQMAHRIIALPRLIKALRAVQELMDGHRDDYGRICNLVDAALATLEEPSTDLLPAPSAS